MYHPECTGLPSNVSNLQCFVADYGGVHSNCGRFFSRLLLTF